jgi:hypothetical protein
MNPSKITARIPRDADPSPTDASHGRTAAGTDVLTIFALSPGGFFGRPTGFAFRFRFPTFPAIFHLLTNHTTAPDGGRIKFIKDFRLTFL